ncbi:MAG: hypothetical protein HY075_07645 [Deltaproteobacteria bacterium]|nr:hypothetical protein [Deltaproteobacteria bacterium]
MSLSDIEKILFVEKELGRCFCSEDCIRDYFQPTVEFMEEEYRKLRSEMDFSDVEALRYQHYRQLALEDPDEVWLETTETGERHFTFVAHFRNGDDRVSYVVVCLAIDGVPSFVFLGFVTRDEDLVDEYRRGNELRVNGESIEQLAEEVAALPEPDFEGSHIQEQQLPPSPPTTLERLYAELRQAGDIPRELFERFEGFVEPTVEDPDEVWRLRDEDGNEFCTFIAGRTLAEGEIEEIDEFIMIVVCDKRFEVVFAFPTLDQGLVQHFRRGINSLNKAFGVGWARGRVA